MIYKHNIKTGKNTTTKNFNYNTKKQTIKYYYNTLNYKQTL